MTKYSKHSSIKYDELVVLSSENPTPQSDDEECDFDLPDEIQYKFTMPNQSLKKKRNGLNSKGSSNLTMP